MTDNASADPVLITGCGWVTPFAAGTIGDVLQSQADAAGSDDASYWPVPDELRENYPHLKGELKADKGAFLTAVALEHARQAASLSGDTYAPERTGLILGCALAGQLGMIQFAEDVRDKTARFVSPINFPQTVGNYISGAEARTFEIRGPNSTLACGAVSGLEAVIEAFQLISTGRADVVFAGGVEVLSPSLAGGLAKPGLTLSEGACLFVLESQERAAQRGATQLATITSFGTLRPDDSPGGEDDDCVLSGTAPADAGVVVVEHHVGHCFGAVGAAAIAAAIGAVNGEKVPVSDPNLPTGFSVRSVASGANRALVYAWAEDNSRRMLELSISPAG